MGCRMSQPVPLSLLPSQTNASPNLYYFLFNSGSGGSLNVSSLTASSITAQNIYTNLLNASTISSLTAEISSISTLSLDLDGQLLTATPTELLLNGVPIATQSSLSTIADWSLDPAISTVQMDGNNIYQAGNISTNSIVGGTAFFGNLMALNSMFLSTYTSTVSSLVETADLGLFSTISTGNLYGGNVEASTLTVANTLSTPSLYVSSINGAEFTSTQITVQVAGVSSLVANTISSIGAELRTALVSTLQFNPSFNPSLDVNLGLGSLFGNLAGAATGALGVLVGGAALGTGIAALAQARQTKTIGNSTFELVNGTTQLQISTLGQTVSSIQRFVNSVDPTTVPGEEVFVSTIIPAGTVCIRSYSDPLNTVSTPLSTIQYFGQWVSMDEVVPPASTISSFNQLFTSSLKASTLAFNNDTLFRAGSSFGGTGGVSTLELYWAGSVPPLDATLRVGDLIISGSDVGGLNYSKDVIIQNLNNGQRLGVYAAGLAGYSTIAFTSDIPAPQPVVSTFRTFGVSSLTGSTISAISGNFNNLAGYTTSPISVLSGLDATGQLIVSDEARANNIAVSTLQNQGPAVSQIAFGGVAGNTLTLNSPNLVITNPIPSVAISTATISSVNGGIPYTTAFPPSQVDNFSTIIVSTIKDQTSSILIQNANLANMSFNTAGDIIGIGTNYINWQVSGGANLAGSIINAGGVPGGSWSNYANGPGYLNASTINVSTNQMLVKNISTNFVSLTDANFQGLSTITFSTSATAGTQSQPAGRLIFSGNDLDAGQQDIWCQQIRLGAGNATNAQTEIIFYDAAAGQRGLQTALQDRTIRVVSTINANQGGYLLDTGINPPFFSTIGNQVNLMAFFPSTINSTIGASTISKMNPVSLYGRSTLVGGTQTIVFSPPYADSNEYSALLTYKDSAGGAPLHANILSISSFSANGTGGGDFFWQTIGRV